MWSFKNGFPHIHGFIYIFTITIVKPMRTMKKSPLPPSKINLKIYKTRHPLPLNWKRNLYTVQLEPVTPPSVHNIPIQCTLTLLSVYLKPWIKEELKYGPRWGVKSKMFSLGSWKMDSAKEHRDYAVKVCIFVF